MKSKPVFPYKDLQSRVSSTLYQLGKFDPRDTNRRRLHGDLVGSIVQGTLIKTADAGARTRTGDYWRQLAETWLKSGRG